MTGKLVGILIVGTSLIAGVVMYYLQVYGYYNEVSAETMQIELISVATGQPEMILADNIQAIDADSSPLRFRACFTTSHTQAMLTESFVIYDGPEPLNAPGWFDCYDAAEVGEALQNDTAIAYLAQENIHDGIDRVIAIFDDGRAFAWHQLNDKFSE